MTGPADFDTLGGGDVEADHGPSASAYEWMGPGDDPDRPSRWRDGDEAVRDDDHEDEGSDDDEP